MTTEGPTAYDAGTIPHCYRHPTRETYISCQRCGRPICPDCMRQASVGFQCPECVREGRKSVRPARTMYGGRAGGAGEITKALVGINVVIYLITAINAGSLINPDPGASIYSNFALRPAFVANGDWWRLASSMFLHYNVIHIAFNMWALYVIGQPLETMLGRLRFLVVYVLAGFGGGVLSFALGPVGESASGASGAIFGLFGAFFVILRRRNLETGGILGVIVVNLILSFTFANIDWRGHVGGLIVGAAVGAVMSYAPATPTRDRVQAAGCLAVAVVVAAAGFAGVARVKHECRTVVPVSAGTQDTVQSCIAAGLPTSG